jgi:PDZ domain
MASSYEVVPVLRRGGGAMMDAQASVPLPRKRPRGGPGTWSRHYCDPAVSPKHAKGQPSPRTSPERMARSEELELPVVAEIASILCPYARHHEPPSVVADVLLRVLPMPDCAHSTIALVVHRKGTGTCDDLTYRQASTLGACDRRTVINRFARTESYGFIRVEQRDYAYGGAAPNLVTAKIPAWVYQQVDDYDAMRPSGRRPDEPATTAPASAVEAVPGVSSLGQPEAAAVGPAVPAVVGAALGAAGAGSVAAAVASPFSAAGEVPLPPASDITAAASDAFPTPAGMERSRAAPVLSPEDAAIDARLEEVHAFTGHRFQVAAIRSLNGRVPERAPNAGVPALDDDQIVAALTEYIKRERPKVERKAKYGEPLPARLWVQNGIHVFLGYKRLRLDERRAERPALSERKRRGPAAPRQTHARGAANLAAAVAPVALGAVLEPQTTIVRAVRPGSIAARLALQPGDKVVRVDGESITGSDELRAVLSTMAPGLHTFELVRSNEVVKATVSLEPRGPPST